jgi:8-oxo-dGTP diphosphatase
MDLAYDMLNLLRVFEEEELSELFYRERLEDDFVREFW